MDKVNFQNNTARVLIIGGVTIPPGSARGVDPRLIPDHLRTPEAPTEVVDEPPAFLALLDGTVKEITEALPTLTLEQLDAIEKAENEGKTRKGLLEAIAADRLVRAQAEAAK